MAKPTKREFFEDALNRVLAITLPRTETEEQIINILFSTEQDLMQAIYFLQDYKSVGFSIIIEKLNDDEAIVKLYDIKSDDFYVCNKVVMQKGLMDEYKTRIKKDTKLSVGILTRTPDGVQIDYANQHKLHLKSIVIKQTKEPFKNSTK